MVAAMTENGLRHSLLAAAVAATLLACSTGLDTRSGTAGPEDFVATAPQMTPEQRAALEEAMAMAERESAEAERAQAEARAAEERKLSLSIASEKASESPRDDGIHDTVNESLMILQNPARAMATFPRDRRGEVDWVASLEAGIIAPRADLQGVGDMEVLDMDVLMKGTQFMPWVKFPHSKHTKWLACSNCHDDIFKPQVGANDISMNAVLSGQFCGVCHGKVSFSLFVCERCHSVPHEGSGKKWW